jgi:glycosyltransferase involved in cell wall biosynthesis
LTQRAAVPAKMTEPSKISVIIPCFNHGEFLPEAVASVLTAGRGDVELIVVDDGSTDERTRAEMDALRARGIKVIQQENKGLAGARNVAIAASRGQYIFPLDADDRMCHGWIDRGIEILDGKPRVGVVYGDAEFFGARTGQLRVGPLDLGRLLARNYMLCSALYRREVWEQNGGYDATMPVQGFEDWDFWVGAVERGWELEYLPEVFFGYRKANESMLTRAYAAESETGEFLARKHGRLYRETLLSVADERDSALQNHQSIKWTLRNLRRLLGSRIQAKLNGRD